MAEAVAPPCVRLTSGMSGSDREVGWLASVHMAQRSTSGKPIASCRRSHSHTRVLCYDVDQQRYKTGVVRRTQLDWNDKAKVLSWRSHGSAGDADVFHEVVGILFVTGAATPTRSATTELTPTGKLQF